VEVQRIAPGLWRWTALHPDWTPDEGGPDGWEREVGCVYYEAPDAVVLIDPLVPPEDADRFWRALDRDVERAARPVAVFLTIFWHQRSTQEVVDRYGASVWAHPQPAHRMHVAITNEFAFGASLPGDVTALTANRGGESIFWIAPHRALVPGDVLLGTPDGGVRVCPDSWLAEDFRGEAFRRSLRPLLDLPVERLLLSHGAPVLANAHAALERALA
jgi:glyoxylase-like metal-dependent hydrolase (beta-lactamase superfamily II)